MERGQFARLFSHNYLLILINLFHSYLYYKPVYYCVQSCAEMTCIIALLFMII